MSNVRPATQGDSVQQKEIWKLCFGDNDLYIDFYYANRYKEDETLVLLEGKEISAMLTMLPIKLITADKRSFKSTMLYAIATHPKYQHRGFATQLISFAHQQLSKNGQAFSILVPSEKQLFDFYRQQGYQAGFYIREALWAGESIDGLDFDVTNPGTILKISPADYNQRRTEHLRGRLHVAYSDDEIAYQAKLSRQSGGDLIGINIGCVQGCAAIERLTSDQILMKEILISDQHLPAAVHEIARLWPAQQYLIRTPAFSGEQLEGTIRPFGMIRAIHATDLELTTEDRGYLGFAFD